MEPGKQHPLHLVLQWLLSLAHRLDPLAGTLKTKMPLENSQRGRLFLIIRCNRIRRDRLYIKIISLIEKKRERGEFVSSDERKSMSG